MNHTAKDMISSITMVLFEVVWTGGVRRILRVTRGEGWGGVVFPVRPIDVFVKAL